MFHELAKSIFPFSVTCSASLPRVWESSGERWCRIVPIYCAFTLFYGPTALIPYYFSPFPRCLHYLSIVPYWVLALFSGKTKLFHKDTQKKDTQIAAAQAHIWNFIFAVLVCVAISVIYCSSVCLITDSLLHRQNLIRPCTLTLWHNFLAARQERFWMLNCVWYVNIGCKCQMGLY